MGFTNICIIHKFIKAKIALKHGTESTNQALSKSAMSETAISNYRFFNLYNINRDLIQFFIHLLKTVLIR